MTLTNPEAVSLVKYLKAKYDPDLDLTLLSSLGYPIEDEKILAAEKLPSIGKLRGFQSIVTNIPMLNSFKIALEKAIAENKTKKKKIPSPKKKKNPSTKEEREKGKKKILKVAFQPRKKIRLDIVTKKSGDIFDNEERKLLWTDVVKWEYCKNGKGNKLSFQCFCPNTKACLQTNRFNPSLKEFTCGSTSNQKCSLNLSSYAATKFLEWLAGIPEVKKARQNVFPIPMCNCKGRNSIVTVRGSAPETTDFRLWFSCPNCRSTFYFRALESKILSQLKKLLTGETGGGASSSSTSSGTRKGISLEGALEDYGLPSSGMEEDDDDDDDDDDIDSDENDDDDDDDEEEDDEEDGEIL